MKRISLPLLKSPTVKYALNIALLQGLFWFAWAFGNYGNYCLQANGFLPSQIGAINSLGCVSGILSSFVFGYISDRINSIKKTFIFTLIISAVILAVFPLIPLHYSYSYALMLIYFTITNFFRGITPTLLDNLSVRTCALLGINFGLIRCIGSITFTGSQLIITNLLKRYSSSLLLPISGILIIPTLILLSVTYDPKLPRQTDAEADEKTGTKPENSVSIKPLLKNYYYLTFVIFAFIFYLAYNCEYTFITYFMAERSIPLHKFAIFVAIRALTEVPTLLVTKHLRCRIKLKYLILLSCGMISVYFFIFAFLAYSIEVMIAVAVLFGLGNGFLIGTFSTYLYKLAPDHQKATSQTMYNAIASAAGIIGNFLSGFIYDAMGGRWFYTLLGGITVFSTLFFAASLFMRKRLPNPGDELN